MAIPWPIKHVTGNIWGGPRMRYDIWAPADYIEHFMSEARKRRTARKLATARQLNQGRRWQKWRTLTQ